MKLDGVNASSYQFGLLHGNGVEMDLGSSRGVPVFITFTVLHFLRGCRGEISSNPPGDVTVGPPVNPADDPSQDGGEVHLPLFTMNYQRIQIPFEITLWIVVASFAKIGMYQQNCDWFLWPYRIGYRLQVTRLKTECFFFFWTKVMSFLRF